MSSANDFTTSFDIFKAVLGQGCADDRIAPNVVLSGTPNRGDCLRVNGQTYVVLMITWKAGFRPAITVKEWGA